MKQRFFSLLGAFCFVCLSIAAAQDAAPTPATDSTTQSTTTEQSGGKKKKGSRVEKLQGKLNLSNEQKSAVQVAIEARKLIKTAQKTGVVSKEDTKAALKANKEAINATLTAEQQAQLDSTRKAVKEKRKASKNN